MVQPNRRRLAWMIFALVSVAGFLALRALRTEPEPPRILFFSVATNLPASPSRGFDRFIPNGWAWYWRAKHWVFGPAAAVQIDTRILETAGDALEFLNDPNSDPSSHVLSPDFHGWFCPTNDLARLRLQWEALPEIETVAAPRAIVGEGMQANLSVFQTLTLNQTPVNVGLTMDVMARRRKTGYDLHWILIGTQMATNEATAAVSIQTNLAVAARIQLPPDQAFILLDARPAKSGQKRQAVVLTVTPR